MRGAYVRGVAPNDATVPRPVVVIPVPEEKHWCYRLYPRSRDKELIRVFLRVTGVATVSRVRATQRVFTKLPAAIRLKTLRLDGKRMKNNATRLPTAWKVERAGTKAGRFGATAQ